MIHMDISCWNEWIWNVAGRNWPFHGSTLQVCCVWLSIGRFISKVIKIMQFLKMWSSSVLLCCRVLGTVGECFMSCSFILSFFFSFFLLKLCDWTLNSLVLHIQRLSDGVPPVILTRVQRWKWPGFCYQSNETMREWNLAFRFTLKSIFGGGWGGAERPSFKTSPLKSQYFTNTSGCLSSLVSLMNFALNQYNSIIIKKMHLKSVFYDPFPCISRSVQIYLQCWLHSRLSGRFTATQSLIAHCRHHSSIPTVPHYHLHENWERQCDRS